MDGYFVRLLWKVIVVSRMQLQVLNFIRILLLEVLFLAWRNRISAVGYF
jgi:hypothetical protein